MSPRIRRQGLLDRTIHRRDARLYVIATEDSYAAPQYFRALQERGLVDRSRISIVVLPTEDGKSAPAWLLSRLDEWKLQQPIDEDEFWLVFDVDHHQEKELSSVATEAQQKKYRLAASNPCFEVWLLLHETDDLSMLMTYSQNMRAAAGCEDELRRVLGTYNKTRIDTTRYTRELVDLASQRAGLRDVGDGSRWPAEVGTHVHRLVKRLPPPAVGQ